MVGLVERAHPQLPVVAAPWPASCSLHGAAAAGYGWTTGGGYESVVLDPRGC